MKTNHQAIPELLAPAGSMETFWAGFKAGADAFYLGAPTFNARRRAKNFSMDDLVTVTRFSHLHGKRVYITLNTLVFDREIPELIDLLNVLNDARVDAVIVQDLGVLRIVKTYFPEIRIHASTQLFCHNSLHAQILKDLGVKRIVLPRELTIEEIGAIKEKVPLEYEAFVHGAMCFSFSGCCLFSSHLFGASGNRGECRQPCRFAFGQKDALTYPFSMKDLSVINHLPEILRKAPLTSLKIEGRLKNAAYVSETVSAYRRVLDDIAAGKSCASGSRASSSSFSGQRQATPGYYFGAGYSDLVNTTSPGTIGEVVGRVVGVFGTEIEIRTTQHLNKGDRLNLQSEEGKRIFEGTLLDFRRKGDVVRWSVRTDDIPASPSLLRNLVVVRTGASAPENPRAFIAGEASKVKEIGMTLTVTYDESNHSLDCAARFSHAITPQASTWPLVLQENPALAWKEDTLRTIFDETGSSPFFLEEFRANLPAGRFCTFKTLKQIRRDLYARISEHITASIRDAGEARRAAIMEEKNSLTAVSGRESGKTFSYGPPPQSRETDFEVMELSLANPPPAPSPRTIVMPPLFVPEGSVNKWKDRLRTLVNQGHTHFLAPTYGWVSVLREAGARIVAGPYFYSVNSFAVKVLDDLGVEEFTLSPDFDPKDVGHLTSRPNYLRAVNPPIEMCVTRLEISGSDYRVKGKTLRIVRKEDYSVLREAVLDS